MGLIVDNFAGGGGASTGIEMALGRPVDIAINHDPEAIAMHQANHPNTRHFCESVWEVDPVEATGGQPVDVAWFSPDCKHFSKAKGGKPREKKIRGLAWVALRWAVRVRPRVIFLENVEEFQTWGPLTEDGNPCPDRKGETFRMFINALRKQGYQVEWKELHAHHYGAPTSRKRLFMVARCDGQPITWPQPTHGPGLLDYRVAAECIDWTQPCPSIFERKRSLSPNTLRRIAQGIQKFVIERKEPFIVTCNHEGAEFRGQGLGEPFKTVTASRDAHGLVMPSLIQVGYGERKGQAPRVLDLNKPLTTVVGEGRKHALAVALLLKHYGGKNTRPAYGPSEPIHTVTSKTPHSLVKACLVRQLGTSNGAPLDEPMRTIMPEGAGGKTSLVYAFLQKYYSAESGQAQSLDDQMHTIRSGDCMSLITVNSEDYVFADIGMRMLQPHELYLAQGFPSDYIIRPDYKGKPLSKTAQTRMCGNSVCPQVAEALVRANVQTMQEVRYA